MKVHPTDSCRNVAWLLVIALCITMLSGCGGSIDSRLVGKWQARASLVSDLEVDFRADGTATVTSSEGGPAKTHPCRWYAVSSSGNSLTINLKPDSKSSYEPRQIIFRGDDVMDLYGANGRDYRRYHRAAAK